MRISSETGYAVSELEKRRFQAILREIRAKQRYDLSKQFMQHGNTSVYQHSIRVAWNSMKLAKRLPFTVSEEELIRGALLHDYFLYDWHEKDSSHSLHGFRHPYTALQNAESDFSLSERERNMILRHMFPLIPIPPMCREAWILCVVDKACSVYEAAGGKRRAGQTR